MKLPLWKALLAILASTLLISGSAYGLYFYSRHLTITRVKHSGELPTGYLAFLLNLPTSFAAFDPEVARAALQKSPYIESAKLRLRPPHTLHVTYTTRKPIALLLERTHLALTSDGHLIPSDCHDLPFVHLGNASPQLAVTVLQACPEATLVDVANAHAESLGRRQIVVGVDGHLLRLTSPHLDEALTNYQRLRPRLPPHSVVDLRLPKLAFITPGEATCLSLS